MIFVYGDLLEADVDAICQQVNCRNAMGSGLAKEIYMRFPVVKDLYHMVCASVDDPKDLLGTVQVIRKHGDLPFDVVNVFGQLNYGREKRCYTSYEALRTAFLEINDLYRGKKLGFPYKFACGLAGGNWILVQELMKTCMPGCETYVYIKK